MSHRICEVGPNGETPDRIETTDSWECWVDRDMLVFWKMYERDFDQWWSTWERYGEHVLYWDKWEYEPSREEVVQTVVDSIYEKNIY